MGSLEVRENVPLAPFSTLGIGGPARYYARTAARDDVAAAVRWARDGRHPLFVMGGGSNVLIADEGFPGLVLHVALRGVQVHVSTGSVELTAGAGEDWDALVDETVAQGWAGFECLSGIPGLTGATPIQNVGAYGQEIAETLIGVEALELDSGSVVRLSGAECGLAYRQSRFKGPDRGRYLILSVSYRLDQGGPPAVRYPELERYLVEGGCARPTLADVRRAVLAIRRRKSMVLDAADPNARSVGSFFMNPLVSESQLAELEAAEIRRGLRAGELPSFAAGEGRVKLPAAWLIERAGFMRGDRRGRVGISERHTLALVNLGGATAREVVALAREIRDRVRDRFGLTLQPEPVFVNIPSEEGLGV